MYTYIHVLLKFLIIKYLLTSNKSQPDLAILLKRFVIAEDFLYFYGKTKREETFLFSHLMYVKYLLIKHNSC